MDISPAGRFPTSLECAFLHTERFPENDASDLQQGRSDRVGTPQSARFATSHENLVTRRVGGVTYDTGPSLAARKRRFAGEFAVPGMRNCCSRNAHAEAVLLRLKGSCKEAGENTAHHQRHAKG
jgi:hypothetical protein